MIDFIVIFLSLSLLLALVYLLIFIRPRRLKTIDPCLLCNYAHRGLFGQDVPENSLTAFRAAVDKGVGIELDVQLSSDGEVMVFHDYDLRRMAGIDKKLSELSSDELSDIALLGTDQTIPSFSQVLRTVNGRVPLLIELKGESLDSSLCGRVADILKEYDGPYCIESFNPLLIKNIRKYLPNAVCGQLYTNVCRDKKLSPLAVLLSLMAFNFISRPDFIAYNKLDRHSLPVFITTKIYKAHPFVWTVRGDEELQKAGNLCEHAIFEK